MVAASHRASWCGTSKRKVLEYHARTCTSKHQAACGSVRTRRQLRGSSFGRQTPVRIGGAFLGAFVISVCRFFVRTSSWSGPSRPTNPTSQRGPSSTSRCTRCTAGAAGSERRTVTTSATRCTESYSGSWESRRRWSRGVENPRDVGPADIKVQKDDMAWVPDVGVCPGTPNFVALHR